MNVLLGYKYCSANLLAEIKVIKNPMKRCVRKEYLQMWAALIGVVKGKVPPLLTR